MPTTTITPEQIAPVVHEAIRAYQKQLGQPVNPPWDEATWEKESTIEAVRFALDSPAPGQQHAKWMDDRIAAGWTYGPVKDSVAKTNPALRPFQELPESEKAKDSIVIALTQALRGVTMPTVTT